MKKFIFLFLFSIIELCSSINTTKEIGDLLLLPIEVTSKIVSYDTWENQLELRFINKYFDRAIQENVVRQWNWKEQIPKLFYEEFYRIRRQLAKEKDQEKKAVMLKCAQVPDFIKLIIPQHFKNSVPYFCFHDLFNFNSNFAFNFDFDRDLDYREYCNIYILKKASSFGKYTLEWDTNFNNTSSRNKLKIQHSNVLYDVSDDKKIENNFYISDDGPDKDTIFILEISNPDNWEAVLKKLLEDKITRKIYILQIKSEIEETHFKTIAPLLKELGEKLILSVEPATRILCITSRIKIVLPCQYTNDEIITAEIDKKNKKITEGLLQKLDEKPIDNEDRIKIHCGYRDIIKRLVKNKLTKNYSSIWTLDNIKDCFKNNVFEKFLAFQKLIHILGINNNKKIDLMLEDYVKGNPLYKSDQATLWRLFGLYNVKKFYLKQLKVFIKKLRRSDALENFMLRLDIFNHLEEIARESQNEKIMQDTILLLTTAQYASACNLLKEIKNPENLRNVIPKFLNVLFHTDRTSYSTLKYASRDSELFSSDFCIKLYVQATNIPGFTETPEFINFQYNLITKYYGKPKKEDKKNQYNNTSNYQFQDAFLKVMSTANKKDLLNDIHRNIYLILDCFYECNQFCDCNFLIDQKKAQEWFNLFDHIARQNLTFEDREKIDSYIELYLNLQLQNPDEGDKISALVLNLKNELNKDHYSPELKSMIAFSLCKYGKTRYEISDESWNNMIEKTGIFSIDLLCDKLLEFSNEKNRKDYSLVTIKKLITTAINFPTPIVDESFLLKFLEMHVTTYEILAPHLTPEEITFLEQIAYATKQYFKAMEKILNLKNHTEDKIKILYRYYEINKNECCCDAQQLVNIFTFTKDCDDESKLIIENMLKNSYEKYIEKEKNARFLDLAINFRGYSKTLLEAQKNNINRKRFFEDLIEITAEKYFNALFHPELKKYNLTNTIQSYFQETKHTTEFISTIVTDKLVAFYDNDILKLVSILKDISNSEEESIKLLIEKISEKCYQNLREQIKNFNASKVEEITANILSIENLEQYLFLEQLLGSIFQEKIMLYLMDNSMNFEFPEIDKFLKTILNENQKNISVLSTTIQYFCLMPPNIDNFIEKHRCKNMDIRDICIRLIEHNKPFLQPLLREFSKKLNGFFNILSLYMTASKNNNHEIKYICKLKLEFRLAPFMWLAFFYFVNKKYHFTDTLFKPKKVN